MIGAGGSLCFMLPSFDSIIARRPGPPHARRREGAHAISVREGARGLGPPHAGRSQARGSTIPLQMF
jgi:hypothetical protein